MWEIEARRHAFLFEFHLTARKHQETLTVISLPTGTPYWLSFEYMG